VIEPHLRETQEYLTVICCDVVVVVVVVAE
jgi:hypothetical protein